MSAAVYHHWLTMVQVAAECKYVSRRTHGKGQSGKRNPP